MNLKAPKTLAMFAAIIVVLLMGTILISGGCDYGAVKADTDPQIIQASAYPADSDKPCDAAKKEVKTCPFKSDNPGHEVKNHPPECKMECCAAKKEAKTCRAKSDNPGCKAKKDTKHCSK